MHVQPLDFLNLNTPHTSHIPFHFPRENKIFFVSSSMVIRDLTLRSAASFGSFHLIRLLYDEYMFYLIEHQVAEATGVVPIAVILEGIVSTFVFLVLYITKLSFRNKILWKIV